MAFTYGSVTKCKVANGQTRNEYECRLGYEVQSQSIANNTSSVKLRLQVRSISSSYKTYGYNQTTTIDGTALSAKEFDMRDTNTWKTFGERTITVSHNASGSYSASKSGSFTTTASSGYSLKSGSASVTVAPATIPRYATANQSLNSRSATSITMNWSSDSTIDYLWYSKDNGSNWTGVDVSDGTSGTYTISSLTPGTTYNIKTRVRRKDSQLTTDSGVLSVTTLDYASITRFDLVAVDETNIRVTWDASKSCDAVQYSLDGAGWVGGTYPNINIGGLGANTYHTVKIRIKATDSQLWTESSVKGVTTYDYPKPTTINDFTIGEGASINLYNPLDRNCRLDIISNNTGAIIGTFAGVYEGIVNAEFKTADAISKQYASIPNSQSGTYYAKVTYGNSVKTLGNKTYRIKGNENPTFNNFEYQDTNAKTLALTNNSQILINGFSNLKVTISSANKAYSNYSSPIKRYRLNVGNMSSVEASYKSDGNVEMSINSVNSPSITVTAIDGRELPAQQIRTATFKDYKKPVITSLLPERNNYGIGDQVTLNFEGEWWNDNFGKEQNVIRDIKYFYKLTTSSEWIEGNIQIIPNISGKYFNGSVKIEGPTSDTKGFDVSSSYNIKMIVYDMLSNSTEYHAILGTGKPAIAIWENNVAIGSKYDEQLGGLLQVNGDITMLGKSLIDTIGNWGNTDDPGDFEGNLDDIKRTSFIMTNSATLNNPYTGPFYVLTFVKNPTYYIVQIAIERDSTFPGFWVRKKTGSTNWTNWIYGEELYRFSTLTDCNIVPSHPPITICDFAINAAHKPPGGEGNYNGFIITYTPAEDYVYQLAITGTRPVKLFSRCKYSGTWYDWVSVYYSEEVLYNNSSGSTGTITLSRNVKDFHRLYIEFRDGDGLRGKFEIIDADDKTVTLTSIYPFNDVSYESHRTIKIKDTTISTVSGNHNQTQLLNGSSVIIAPSNNIFITKVIGINQ